MKKVLLNALLMGAIAFSACKKDDDETPVVQAQVTDICSNCPDDVYEEESGAAKSVVTVSASSKGIGTTSTTWTNDKVWVLDGFVFVNSGQTLTIEPGTVIKGNFGSGAQASALIVARGGKLIAKGTANAPIIMTSAADETYTKNDGTLVLGSNMTASNNGLWGGLIVLGKSRLNSGNGTGDGTAESAIEGIPTSETRGLYGGNNDADNSGVYQYISIRHGGTNIGEGNEINGFTLGGVGSGTTIDHIEVYANADDGIEFFGGTANVKYAVVSNCGDDSFDFDEGYRGKGQFWLTVAGTDSDFGGEHDGGTSPETGTPYSTPTIYNATYIGNGTNNLMLIRDNSGASYHNSIFHNYAGGISVEDLDPSKSAEDSYARLLAGEMSFSGLYFSSVTGTKIYKSDDDSDLTSANGVSNINTVTLSMDASNYSSTAYTVSAPSDSWFDQVTYAGAVGSTDWTAGWTAFSGN